jgi:hypothetical protein
VPWRPDWPAILVLYGAALALRLALWDVPLYGDEAWHYHAARLFGQDAHNVHLMEQEAGFDMSLMFWWRPLFEILLAPGAWMGFGAYRIEHIVLASCLAPLGYLLLRDRGVRAWPAVAAGVVLAVHPLFVRWGVIVFPDGLLTMWVVAAAWAWARGWAIASAALAVAAAWTKEVGAIAVGLLGLCELARSWRLGRVRVWPTRLPPSVVAFLVAAPLAVLPVLWYVTSGGRPPGWNRGGDSLFVLDQVAYSPWLVILVLAGLFLRRSRPLATLAAGYVAFWLGVHFILGRELQGWYFLLPAALVILASVGVLDETWDRLRGFRKVRVVPVLVAAALGFVLVADVVVGSDAEWKGTISQPFTDRSRWSLEETISDDRARVRDNDVLDVAAHLSPQDRDVILLIDFPWFNIFYPMGEVGREVRYGYSGWYDQFETNAELWVEMIETRANATVIFTSWDVGPFHRALVESYASCIAYENPSYVVLRGQECDVGAEALRASYERHKAEQAGA